ncbi:HEAT repeat domain-containing protein [Streptomyces sp. NPDC088560]|uniref:HEAT repeat domain-containing protein n=1 Tax=Streptomyces sp. NPDC088560 TaxID=3365868 RepID=UPI00381F084A
MEGEITRRVAELDAGSTDVAEEAQHALIALGPQVLEPLIAAAPALNPFGQLCAIEVFTALADPRPADVLIGMLSSESATVRQWAAEALAELGVRRAVPRLRQAYDAFLRRGEALDDSEGEGLRWALTELGARRTVLPPRSAALHGSGGTLNDLWPVQHLPEVIRDLADHGQAVLYFQIWELTPDGGRHGVGGPGIDWDVDRDRPWPETVVSCRDWALLAAEAVDVAPDGVVTISWMDATDLRVDTAQEATPLVTEHSICRPEHLGWRSPSASSARHVACEERQALNVSLGTPYEKPGVSRLRRKRLLETAEKRSPSDNPKEKYSSSCPSTHTMRRRIRTELPQCRGDGSRTLRRSHRRPGTEPNRTGPHPSVWPPPALCGNQGYNSLSSFSRAA